MTTCADALRQAVTELGRVVSTREIIDCIYRNYPNRPWKESTIRAHVIGCSVNHSSSHHYPSFPKFLFTVRGGRVRLYNPKTDGRWIVNDKGARLISAEGLEEKEISEEEYLTEEATISLEKDLENFLLAKLNVLEEGLRLYKGETGRQFQVQSGRIDILAQDKDNNFVVLELKAGTATDAALAQILSYMADITREVSMGKPVRGIIVAYDFAQRLMAATSLLPTIKLMKYKVNFEFEEVTSNALRIRKP